MIRRINYDDVSKIVELENNTLGTTLGEKMLDMAIRSPLAYYYCYVENNKLSISQNTKLRSNKKSNLKSSAAPTNQKGKISIS